MQPHNRSYKGQPGRPQDHMPGYMGNQDWDMKDVQCTSSYSSGRRGTDKPTQGFGGATSRKAQHPHQTGPAFQSFHDPHLSGATSGTGQHMHPHWGIADPRQQDQEQLFRCKEASRQILYDTYDYTIGMIEELEKHETHGSGVQNSGILSKIIPMNYKKPKNDVMAGIELELQCLDVQMQAIPQDIINAAKEDLVKRTLRWAAVRSDQHVPFGDVDRYGQNVLRILLKYSMQLPPRQRGPNTFTEEQVNKAMYEMAKGRHYGDKQDEEFNTDPKKKAKLRDVRQGDLREGAKRLTHGDKTLEKDLFKYIQDFEVDLM